jgi:cation:H+ antiporter
MGGAVLLLLGGAVLLTLGAEGAVRGAVRYARDRGLSPFVLGALLFGVDLESLGATLVASGRGQTAMAAGEAFGTVVFVFSVGLGAALLVAPRPVPAPRADMVLWPGATVLVGALALADRTVGRAEGLGLVAAYAGYVAAVLRGRRAVQPAGARLEDEAAEAPRLPVAALLFGGLGLLYAGANLMVEGGVRLLELTGLSAGFVGAALLGTLATADDVLLEVLPVRRGAPELATGNLLGTAAAFTTGVPGLAALVQPLQVDAAARSAFLLAAALYALVAAALLLRGRAGRLLGLGLLGLYGAWLALAAGL